MAITLILLAAVASWFDMHKGIIPNRLVFPGMGIGIALRIAMDIFEKEPWDILSMALEVLVLFFCLWHVFAIGGLGAGDCKLLLLAGVFLPVQQAVLVIISTFFIAAIEIILLWLICRIKRKRQNITEIHFAPSFLLAVLFYQCENIIHIF